MVQAILRKKGRAKLIIRANDIESVRKGATQQITVPRNGMRVREGNEDKEVESRLDRLIALTFEGLSFPFFFSTVARPSFSASSVAERALIRFASSSS